MAPGDLIDPAVDIPEGALVATGDFGEETGLVAFVGEDGLPMSGVGPIKVSKRSRLPTIIVGPINASNLRCCLF